eukprot:g2752.t1
MARRVETGLGSWAALVLLLVSSSVVLGLEWSKECDGGLRNWLLTTVVVTAICGILGALFHGKGDGTRPSRFLDEDEDDVWGVDDDSVGVSVSSSAGGGGGGVGGGVMGRGSTENNSTSSSSREEGGGLRATPASKAEEGRAGIEARRTGAEAANGAGGPVQEGEPSRRDSMGEDSIVSGVPSSISYRLASQSSSLQHRYFGPGPKVFPDAIFFILVVSQWFLAGWSVVGAALYFRLFNGNRTCSPLLRHWTLLVVIIGFLSCLLAVCYSGIMCCMMGAPFSSRRRNGGSERDRFQGDVPSSSDGVGPSNNPGLM